MGSGSFQSNGAVSDIFALPAAVSAVNRHSTFCREFQEWW